VQPLEPEWLRQMYAEGWQKVEKGVLQRDTGGGELETFSYGAEGLQWVAQRYKEQVASLERRYDADPSEDLAGLIDQIEGQILLLEGTIDSAPTAESFAGESLAACNVSYGDSYGGDSFAGSQIGAQGVTATASAYFHNNCGYVGDTFTTAHAEAIAATGQTSITQSDPKNGGAWIDSYSSASANGSSGCWAWAQGSVTVSALSINYQTPYRETYNCSPVAGTSMASVARPIAAIPAATLLLPYFQVDLDNAIGVNTLFSVNNAVASAQLAHVTVWSTWSVPVLTFDVYLTGFDVQTFNLREILVDGILPQTGSGTTIAANDPGSPLGAYSSGDVAFPNCNTTATASTSPVYSIPAISLTFRTHLRASLTGKQSQVTGTCAGTNYGDNIARGYVTVDDANSCSQLFPSSSGYFSSGGLGVAGNDNVLWGDYTYVDPGENYAQGETLVHIQADAATFNTLGEYTFYGRYVGGSAADNRQPLPTSFATRYNTGGGFTGDTDLIVWRDSKALPGGSCAAGPNFGSLNESQVVGFDEAENVDFDCRSCGLFPDATQYVSTSSLPIASDSGWLYLNLNHASPSDSSLKSGYAGIAQAWVVTLKSAEGRYSVGYDAIQLDNANTAVNPGGRIIPP
jgi:hypothetical protein